MATFITAYIIAPKPDTSVADRYGKFVVEMEEEATEDKARQIVAAKKRFLELAAGDEVDEAEEPEWTAGHFDDYWTIEEAEDIFHADRK